jgi:hypothetical protein
MLLRTSINDYYNIKLHIYVKIHFLKKERVSVFTLVGILF